MLTFKQFLARELKENRRQYSRLLQHFTSDPFVIIISVERNHYEVGVSIIGEDNDFDDIIAQGNAENFKNTDEFRGQLRTIRNCGFIPVKGSYKETYTYYDRQTRKRVKKTELITEHSQIVYCTEQNWEQVWELCWKYATKTNQHSILVVKKARAYYYFPSEPTKSPEPKGVFHPRQIGEYYTELHEGKRFSFSTDPSKLSNTLIKYLQIADNEIEQYRKLYNKEIENQTKD